MAMKRTLILIFISMVSSTLISCSPVLSKRLMREGTREVSFSALRANPDAYRGRLFILGGVIIDTKYTEKGSEIEALHVPVDSYGYLKSTKHSEGRYLAILPRANGMLDSVIYRRGREITVAGEFTGTLKGKIEDMEYVYPVFEIQQVYLWEERQYYMIPYDTYYPYPYWWGYPYWWYYPPSYWYVPAPVPQQPPAPPPPAPFRRPPVREREGERGGR